MDWSLFGCARKGHVTYAPDEAELRGRLTVSTPGGAAWRCLRCGAFVTDSKHGSGPAAQAPLVRRGKELRSELILRVFAVDRFVRFLIFAGAAYGVWRFKYDRAGIQRAFNNDLPAIRALYSDLGFNVAHSKLLGLIQSSFSLNSRTLTYLAIGLAVYALIELVEGIALWQGKRWGEYFAVAATSLFLPYEVYDLTVKMTWLRIAAFAVNLLLVIYLIYSKRLFGVRGGKHAYEAALRSESVIEVEQAALMSAVPSARPAPGNSSPLPTARHAATANPLPLRTARRPVPVRAVRLPAAHRPSRLTHRYLLPLTHCLSPAVLPTHCAVGPAAHSAVVVWLVVDGPGVRRPVTAGQSDSQQS
jgi:uncharacterized membrane protein (DUF2068 family)